MTIEKAGDHLFKSKKFKEDAKTNAALRVYLGRFKNRKLKNASLIELLVKYGYKLEVYVPKKV